MVVTGERGELEAERVIFKEQQGLVLGLIIIMLNFVSFFNHKKFVCLPSAARYTSHELRYKNKELIKFNLNFIIVSRIVA